MGTLCPDDLDMAEKSGRPHLAGGENDANFGAERAISEGIVLNRWPVQIPEQLTADEAVTIGVKVMLIVSA